MQTNQSRPGDRGLELKQVTPAELNLPSPPLVRLEN
jgi:hypothetical protein